MSRVPSAGAAIYRAAVLLYPPAFRRDFAGEMTRDFAEASREVWHAASWPGLLRLWGQTLNDLLRTAAFQWWRTGLPVLALLASLPVLGTIVAASSFTGIGSLPPGLQPADEELLAVLMMMGCVLLIIIATLVFTLWFTRPLRRPRG